MISTACGRCGVSSETEQDSDLCIRPFIYFTEGLLLGEDGNAGLLTRVLLADTNAQFGAISTAGSGTPLNTHFPAFLHHLGSPIPRVSALDMA